MNVHSKLVFPVNNRTRDYDMSELKHRASKLQRFQAICDSQNSTSTECQFITELGKVLGFMTSTINQLNDFDSYLEHMVKDELRSWKRVENDWKQILLHLDQKDSKNRIKSEIGNRIINCPSSCPCVML